MPRLRCPRCSTVVEVAAGLPPSCPACGFGAAAPTQASAVAPASPATPASVGPAATKPRGKVVAIAVVVALVAAGALAATAFVLLRDGPASALTQEEAEQRVAAALAGLPGAMSGEGGGGLRQVTMTMEASEAAPGSPEDLFGGFGQMAMTIRYGRGDVVEFDLDVTSGAVTVAFRLLCTPTQQFISYGGQTYGSRMVVAAAADAEEDPCAGMGGFFDEDLEGLDEGSDGEDGLDGPLPPIEDLAAEDADIERRSDGSLVATFTDDGEDVVVEIDAEGRVVSVVSDSPEGHAEMEFDYGPLGSIALPQDYELLPAEVELDEDRGGGGLRAWTVAASPHEPPLAELEVRVQDWGASFGGAPDPEDVLARFQLTAAEQVQGNYTFRFRDADGNGRLSAGDSFTILDAAVAQQEAEAGEDDFFGGFSLPPQVVLYDLVADGEVNSTPMGAPSPGAALLALALAGLAAALRRRR